MQQPRKKSNVPLNQCGQFWNNQMYFLYSNTCIKTWGWNGAPCICSNYLHSTVRKLLYWQIQISHLLLCPVIKTWYIHYKDKPIMPHHCCYLNEELRIKIMKESSYYYIAIISYWQPSSSTLPFTAGNGPTWNVGMK